MKNEDVTKWANRYGLDKFPSELRAMINDAHELVQQEDDLYTTPPAAQPAPVQEPVAWMHTMIEDVVVGHRPADLNVHPDRWMPLYKDPTPCKTCEALARTVMMDQTAHDHTPPAQQAMPLTVEQIYEIADSWAPDLEKGALCRVVREVEAAHGITKGQP